MPENGGVVMVTFVPDFVSKAFHDSLEAWTPQLRSRLEGISDSAERGRIRREFRETHELPHASIADVADHIEHVRDVAGVDHVGLGGDYDGTGMLPEGLGDVSTYPNLFAELIRRGWSDADLKKLASGNILRAMREAEAAAKRLRAARSPSIATIEQLDGPAPAK
jgi:membrane dipeptidase